MVQIYQNGRAIAIFASYLHKFVSKLHQSNLAMLLLLKGNTIFTMEKDPGTCHGLDITLYFKLYILIAIELKVMY